MVYDNTQAHRVLRPSSQSGFAIHDGGEALTEADLLTRGSEHRYSLYTDDGRGNGDFVCGSSDLYWIRRIAYSLDFVSGQGFTYDGLVKVAGVEWDAPAKGAVAGL